MAPRKGTWRPSDRITPLYDANRDRKTDPSKIAYSLTHEAAKVLVVASKFKATPQNIVNGYAARHLVDKGCLSRLPGRNTSYRITLRGEAVVECLRGRDKMKYLFQEKPAPEA